MRIPRRVEDGAESYLIAFEQMRDAGVLGKVCRGVWRVVEMQVGAHYEGTRRWRRRILRSSQYSRESA
jgi:hypothetical protein